MDTQMPAPVAAEQSLLTQDDVLNLLVKLAEHAEAKSVEFKQFLAELCDYHKDVRGRDIEALRKDINVCVFKPALAALSDRKGLDKLRDYWAASLLHELAKPLEQLKVAEVRRLTRPLFEPLTGEVGWDA